MARDCQAWRTGYPDQGTSRPTWRGATAQLAILVTLLACAWLAPRLATPQPPPKDRPAPPVAQPEGSRRFIYINPEGKARVPLFGVTGEGYKFVYVMDRSGSMGGSGREALRVLKAELLASLRALDTIHQFQIVFYNQRPIVFNPSGVPGRLAFATQQNKDRAFRFIQSITADGGTSHDEALKLAIRLRPDVIFFLTDGDDPKLSRKDLDQIQRMATGITIHAIQFGSGPKPGEKSFLEVLAEENGGQYTYVDILDWPPKSSKAKQ